MCRHVLGEVRTEDGETLQISADRLAPYDGPVEDGVTVQCVHTDSDEEPRKMTPREAVRMAEALIQAAHLASHWPLPGSSVPIPISHGRRHRTW